MALLERGSSTPEAGRGRVRLTTRDPDVEKLLAGLAIDGEVLAEARSSCKAVCRSRNAWSVQQARLQHDAREWLRKGGFASRGGGGGRS